MSGNFDWQTEEVEPWPDMMVVLPGPERLPLWHRLSVVLVVALALISGWVIFRQVERRITEAAARVEADVLVAHTLVLQAAQQQDVELLETVLSGRDQRWTAAQKALAKDGLLFDRSSFGFQMRPEDVFPVVAPDNITITLASDLTAAEVTWLEPLAVTGNKGTTETVSLQQTAIYRQGARNWLLSPPERRFWGEWQQARGAYVTLVYPQRDEPVARRLVHDLDAVIVRVCTQLEGVRCPAGLSLRLRLETDARSLLAVHDVETTITSGRSLDLPTPTLVGLPVDESGYQALVRGYGAHVALALITELVGYECCIHGLLYGALLDKQLSQLGLRPWPLTESGYEQLLSNPGSLRPGLGPLWTRRSLELPADDEWMQVYSLADFLLMEVIPEAAVAEIQRTLGRRSSFAAWFTRISRLPYDASAFNAAWLAFIYQRSASARVDLPIPLPKSDLRLVCSQRNQGVWLHRYDWDTGRWRQEFGRVYESGPASGYLYPLPGESGVVLQEAFFPNAQGEVRLSAWQNGHEIFALDQSPGVTASSYPYYFDGTDLTGHYLVLRTLGQRRDARYQLLDLANCDQGVCETLSLPGQPLWSPDGRQTLLLGEPPVVTAAAGAEPDPWGAPLYLGDALGQAAVALGTGIEPFWLDDEMYGYLRRTGDDVELVTAAAGDDSPHVILRATDLLPLMSPIPPGNVTVDTVLANPGDMAQLLVTARNVETKGSEQIAFFLLELTAGGRAVLTITQLFQTDRPASVSGFSPNGRWLVISTWNAAERNNDVHLIDLLDHETQTFAASGFRLLWSADSQWLVQPEGEYLLLRAPAYNYKRLLLHDYSNCYSAHWVNGEIRN